MISEVPPPPPTHSLLQTHRSDNNDKNSAMARKLMKEHRAIRAGLTIFCALGNKSQSPPPVFDVMLVTAI